MSINKLSSDEVPEKFTEWLLAMGCPSEKVPSTELAAQMSRGQYYMVWRSLIENVAPKDDVKYKRLLVFSDDIQNCRDKKDKTHIPKELNLLRQHEDLKKKISSMEIKLKNSEKDMHQLIDKLSMKLSQRNLARRSLTDAQRRLNLLQRVSEELQSKKSNLKETLSIANSLCRIENEEDAENKLEKCIAIVRRGPSRGTSEASTTLQNVHSMSFSSSTMSTCSDIDTEEQLLSLVSCGGDKLWPLLCERRSALCSALTNDNVKQDVKRSDQRSTPSSVLSHTSALHCTIALEAKKNKLNITHTGKRFFEAIASLCTHATSESCEHIVVCCERVRAQARVNALKCLLDDVTHRKGMFEIDGRHVVERHAARRIISNLDKAIVTKKDDLKRAMSSLRMTEKKIENVKECLEVLFKSFQDHEKLNDVARYGDQIPISQESMSKLAQFYEEKRERYKNKANISMDFDISDNTFASITGNDSTPRFINELKLYLERFCLEKNRKLVLESGEKIWVFETLESSLLRLYAKWQSEDVTNSLLCPSVNLHRNIQNVLDKVLLKDENRFVLKEIEGRIKKDDLDTDITKIREEENKTTDKIKKRLDENLRSLKDTSRTLNICFENLGLWSKDDFKKYISTTRRVNGKTYKEYEKYYLECINI